MADPQSEPFLWSDAWLLLAVAAAEREGKDGLQAVVAWADAIQHAIIALEELNGGVARLRAAGYLGLTAGRLSITPAGRTLLSQAGRRSYSATQIALEKLLRATAWSAEYRPPDAASDAVDSFSKGEYEAAVHAYTARLGARSRAKRA